MVTDREMMCAVFDAVGLLYARLFGERMEVRVETSDGYVVITGPAAVAHLANSGEPLAKPDSLHHELYAIPGVSAESDQPISNRQH